MGTLTAAKIRSIDRPGRYGDSNGLYLHVAPGGTKSWVLRIVARGKRRDIGLGSFRRVGLAQARILAEQTRAELYEGKYPNNRRKISETPTFADAARKTYESNLPRWRKHRRTEEWIKSLERHVFPRIGNTPVHEISLRDVLAVLEPIWGVKQETARRIRQRMRLTFLWAIAHDYIGYNPVGEAIDGALPKMPRSRNHMRAVHYKEVAKAMAIVQSSNACLASKLCLKFAVFTAARSGEARGAMWSEIDREKREWRVPGPRMKNGREHRVHLSSAALDVLNEAHILKDASGLVFPSPTGKMLSDSTLSKLLREQGIDGVPHGFRSSFRDWATEETKAEYDVMEMCLAHTVRTSSVRSYARSERLPDRRKLLDKWALYLTKEEST